MSSITSYLATFYKMATEKIRQKTVLPTKNNISCFRKCPQNSIVTKPSSGKRGDIV